MINRTRWEYSRINVLMTKKGPIVTVNGSQVPTSNLTDLLNEAGADGWEMVGMTTMANERDGEILTVYALKRPA